jgi:hypothetical protein
MDAGGEGEQDQRVVEESVEEVVEAEPLAEHGVRSEQADSDRSHDRPPTGEPWLEGSSLERGETAHQAVIGARCGPV